MPLKDDLELFERHSHAVAVDNDEIHHSIGKDLQPLLMTGINQLTVWHTRLPADSFRSEDACMGAARQSQPVPSPPTSGPTVIPACRTRPQLRSDQTQEDDKAQAAVPTTKGSVSLRELE